MGYSAMTFNLQLSSVAIALMCVLFFHISFASAMSVWRNEVPAFDNLSKRDVVPGVSLSPPGATRVPVNPSNATGVKAMPDSRKGVLRENRYRPVSVRRFGNCPGGYILKRSRLAEKLLDREPQLPGEDDVEQTKEAIMDTDEDLRRNVDDLRNELKNEMRYRLLDMLRSSSTESLEENKEDW